MDRNDIIFTDVFKDQEIIFTLLYILNFQELKFFNY